jgi:hypothetical protein
MTKETIQRHYEWFKFLSSGQFTERDFDFQTKERDRRGEEAGRMTIGKMSQARINLIKSDAKRHLDNLIKKHPWVLEQKEEEKPLNAKNILKNKEVK